MITILEGDCRHVLKGLPDETVQTCVTSPPYFGLRDYGHGEQIGLEKTPDEFVKNIVEIMREVRRVLKKDGTLWLNLGDSYAFGGCGARNPDRWPKQSRNDHHARHSKKVEGLKPKNLIGIPWRVAFALQADGWYLRQDIIWHKRNPMPESVKDRCTKAHEYIFLLSKSPEYYFNADAIKEPAQKWGERDRTNGKYHKEGTGLHPHRGLKGNKKNENVEEFRNKRDVWTTSTRAFKGAHFATFPPELIEPCILAGAPAGGVVLDPFFGAGTTGLVSVRHERQCIGVELNPEYIKLAEQRLGLDLV